MNKITIAIDGFSSTGKSTVAKQLAKHLGYIYVDSGAMYRAVTWFAMQEGFINQDRFYKTALIHRLNDVEVSFKFNPDLGFSEVYLNGTNVEKEIRTLEVSSFVSQVAKVSEVRKQLVKQQHELGMNKGIVMDGRDIGTVVFPNAELKIFMTASAETRANRRYQELISKGENVTFEEVLHNVQERDYMDSNRKDSPLFKAEDAVEIDNSHMTLDQQFNKILQLVETKLKVNN
ncbi:(d)CMP kinase [Xanthomarina sp.]|uniref:(d)CMP kinase n=1 Tax=Xanthomarina sp. TaxID=1931211 RepID=UPI002CB85417|nr:(d)CMP kinase [Xanthomarina sp.]HLV39052.1 (d)CMP kinase [Xanthomarina sp.]